MEKNKAGKETGEVEGVAVLYEVLREGHMWSVTAESSAGAQALRQALERHRIIKEADVA